MNIRLTMFLLFIVLNSYGQDHYFVNAKNGLNVRSEASLSSKKIGKIRFGAMVEKIAETDKIVTIADNGKLIKGKFIKIKLYNKEYKEGYLFDAYLTKQIDKEALNIEQIDETLFLKLSKKSLNKKHHPKKITNLDSVKQILKNRVEWLDTILLKSIKFSNGNKIEFKGGSEDFGFWDDSFCAYYPEYDILVLSGGHSSDVCYSLTTGETEGTIGNPEYIVTSPKNSYRLNGSHGGQECISYFIQKKEKGKFTYITSIDLDYEVCVFKTFCWISENKFIYTKMNYSEDSKNGIEEYYKGEIYE